MLLAWWISPYLVRGLKLMNRLDQLELHKAMAMELKWAMPSPMLYIFKPKHLWSVNGKGTNFGD